MHKGKKILETIVFILTEMILTLNYLMFSADIFIINFLSTEHSNWISGKLVILGTGHNLTSVGGIPPGDSDEAF